MPVGHGSVTQVGPGMQGHGFEVHRQGARTRGRVTLTLPGARIQKAVPDPWRQGRVGGDPAGWTGRCGGRSEDAVSWGGPVGARAPTGGAGSGQPPIWPPRGGHQQPRETPGPRFVHMCTNGQDPGIIGKGVCTLGFG
jgi:hypothetical protein